jgi:hypothetical protein
VGKVKLARSGSRTTPGLDELPIGGELVHPGVGVTVGDEYLTGVVDGDACG